MPYTVQSSEKTRKSGAEGETKALLYLMNFRSDSNEIPPLFPNVLETLCSRTFDFLIEHVSKIL